jgi:large subunit ribosomal protein L4
MTDISTSLRAKPRPLAEPVVLARTTDLGEPLSTVALDAAFFSVPENVTLVHQVVTAQLASRRRGTQSTKTRAEVRGGGAKPYRQKGTGNARQGSIRAPHYAGGGVALGPKPRDYSQRTPRKMTQQALRCALSDRARSGGVRLIDRWSFEEPKTKRALDSLDALDCQGRVLVVTERDANAVEKSMRNIPGVEALPVDQLNAYEVMRADVVVFTDATMPGEVTTNEVAQQAVKRGAAPERVPAKKVPAKKVAAKKVPAKKVAAKKVPAKKVPAKNVDAPKLSENRADDEGGEDES